MKGHRRQAFERDAAGVPISDGADTGARAARAPRTRPASSPSSPATRSSRRGPRRAPAALAAGGRGACPQTTCAPRQRRAVRLRPSRRPRRRLPDAAAGRAAGARAVGTPDRRPQGPRRADGPAPLARLLARGARRLGGARGAAGLAARARAVPRPQRRPRPGHAADGAAAGGRRRGAAARLRPPRPRRPVAGPLASASPSRSPPAGAIIAETFVAMPFLVITVEAGLRSVDRRYEDAAATLGAGRWTTFRRVTLPLIAPSLVAGAALAGRARSASSAPPSPSPATSRARPRPCRWRCTSPSRPTPSGDRAQPGAARGVARRAGRAARPLVPGCGARMSLDAQLVRRPAARSRLDVDLAVATGEVVVAARPERRGQDHRCCAPSPGWCRSTRGRVELDGAVLDDPAPASACPPSAARSASCSRTTCCSRT